MKHMLCALALVLAFCSSLSAYEAFSIESYDITIEVSEANVYSVTERLILNYSEDRQGFFRDIPLVFDRHHLRVRDVEVPGYEYKVSRSRQNLSIRIGSPGVYVYGRVAYEIRYTYDIGADSLRDMDEFNHNLIGLGWDTDIQNATFRVRLPKPFNHQDVNLRSGPYGSTDSSGVAWSVEGQEIRGRLLRPLGPNEGLTLALPLPEGYWVGARRHWPPLSSMLTGYPLYVLLIAASAFLWYRKGRNKKIFPTIEFEPPEGLNPAEVGYIADGTADPEDISALVIHWAQKGFLAIEEKPAGGRGRTELELIRLKDMDASMRPYEKKMFNTLFSMGTDGRVTMSDLAYKFDSAIFEAQREVTAWFENSEERATKDRAAATTRLGCMSVSTGFISGILAFIPLFLLCMDLLKEYTPRYAFSFLAFFIALFITVAYHIAATSLRPHQVVNKRLLLIGGVLSLNFTAGLGVFAMLFTNLGLIDVAAPVVTAMICSGITAVMDKRTAYGDSILAKVLGFRDFIAKAERDKLERMFESDPHYFFNILPYAIVLRLSSKWADHFSSMLITPPDWYRGQRYDRFDSRSFERNLSTNFASFRASMCSTRSSSTSSSSSGSSGSSSSGGFSGGGSGGGGGRSW